MEYLDAMLAELRLRGLRPNTVQGYLDQVELTQRHFGARPLDLLSVAELREYLLHLEREGRLSSGARRLRVFALRFLFRHALRKLEVALELVLPPKPRSKPKVLSREQVTRLLTGTRCPKEESRR